MRVIFSILIFVILLSVLASGAQAQRFPNKPIRILIATAPGGTTDTYSRLVAAPMERRLGQTLLVDNRPGANGTIAAQVLVKSPPDGYTLFFGGVSAINAIFNKNNAVDADKEMTPVSNVIGISFVLYASGKLRVGGLQDLVAYSKANPGKLNYASPAAPTLDLMMFMLKSATGLDYISIPYKGGAAVASAMQVGEAHLTIGTAGTYAPQIQSGGMRPLLALGSRRSSMLPNVPNTTELGLTNFEGTIITNGFWAPLGVSSDIVQRLNTEIVTVVRSPEISDQIRKGAYDPMPSTPEEQLRSFRDEIRFFAEAARLSRFEPQ